MIHRASPYCCRPAMCFEKFMMFSTVTNHIFSLSRVLRFQRNFGTFHLCCCQHDDGASRPAKDVPVLKKWTFTVPPFGHMVVDTGSLVNVFVNRLDPLSYPLQDKAFLTVVTNSSADKLHRNAAQLQCTHIVSDDGKLAKVVLSEQSVRTTENAVETNKQCKTEGHLPHCHIEIPIKFDTSIKVAGQCNVSVSGLENEKLNISVDEGSCSLFKILSQDVCINSSGGDVKSRSILQGNTKISVKKNANVTADRIEGLSFDVQSESGDVKAEALYADEAKFSLTSGNIHLGSCHKSTVVDIKGKGHLRIDRLDGELEASLSEGDAEAFLLQHSKVNIITQQGDIKLKVLDSIEAAIDIQACHVDIQDDLDMSVVMDTHEGSHRRLQGPLRGVNTDKELLSNVDEKQIRLLAANGKVSVACQDWLASLNLATKMD